MKNTPRTLGVKAQGKKTFFFNFERYDLANSEE
jgi:hypothetical protein